MNNKKISVSIIDDHPVVVEGFATMLSGYDDVVLTSRYTAVNELLHGIAIDQPDVLILDIKMPDIGGEELVDKLTVDYPALKLIALTYLDSIYYAKLMMRKGVQGYLLKTCKGPDVIKAIKTVWSGEQYIEESLKEKIFQHALLNKKQTSGTPLISRREKEILQLIASNYNSFDIGKKLFIAKKTVENHRANMLLKFKVKNSASLVMKAIELGLLE